MFWIALAWEYPLLFLLNALSSLRTRPQGGDQLGFSVLCTRPRIRRWTDQQCSGLLEATAVANQKAPSLEG